jgi:hypothetical protein
LGRIPRRGPALSVVEAVAQGRAILTSNFSSDVHFMFDRRAVLLFVFTGLLLTAGRVEAAPIALISAYASITSAQPQKIFNHTSFAFLTESKALICGVVRRRWARRRAISHFSR